MNKSLISNLSIFVMLTFTFSTSFLSFGQDTVQQDTINGQVYFVYPFSISVSPNSNYYVAMKRSRGDRYSMKDYYKSLIGEEFTKKQYRQIAKELRRENFRGTLFRKEDKHLNGKFKKAVRNNPFPLLEQRYSLEHDIIPSLDPIPDGRYVQYFDGYFLLDQKGKTNYIEDQVAGYFTMKDNMLDGEAVWFNVKGDTLKKGMYSKGLKVGEWYLETRKAGYRMDPKNAQLYIDRGYPEIDTTIEYVNYAGGFKNGEYLYFNNSKNPITKGQYKDNVAVGEWIEREVGFIGKGKNRTRNRNNDIITLRYTLSSNEIVSHDPILRKRLIKEMDYTSPYDFISKYSPSISLTRLYSINYPEVVNLDLDEEGITSYDGEIYEDEYYEEEYYGDDIMYDEEYYGEGEYYDDEYYDESGSDYRNMSYDVNSNKYIPTSKLVDSLGIKFMYDGIYEKRYPNGQLMMRYEFKDGHLLKEDTIFWDNGKPYDVITFDTDSNQFVRKIYDYKGKLYNEVAYDSKGEFSHFIFKPITVKYFMLDGYLVEDEKNARFFFYDKLDTLENELSDSLVLFRSWFKTDSTLLYSRQYNPKERTLTFDSYAIMGKPSLSAELSFGEDFESWTGFKNYHYGNLTLKTTTSASYSEWMEKDSFPQLHVNQYGRNFSLTDEYLFKQNGKPFTGPISVTMNDKKLAYSSGKSINLTFQRAYLSTEKLQKDLDNYRLTGKTKNEVLFSTIDASEIEEDYSNTIFNALFDGFIGEYVNYPYADYYYEGYDNPKKYREKKQGTFSKTIEGNMLDGKPDGLWIVKDQFGKVMYEIPFANGLINGTVKEYDYAQPRNEYDYYYMEEPNLLKDTMPRKKTHYLFSTTEFKNGFKNGEYNQFNWLGQMNKQDMYVDGYRNGISFERNNLAYTSMTFKDGALDGYVKTYLTLKGKDSILLYDLNFQNGSLQGESKAFHLNGRLAKKGFFLNGDPIEDYEAYDTLGFKYHYVKFLYSYPIEEKIWEENQLSVRYLFDWRDSIYFQPSDITTSQSLDRTLAQLGIGRDYYSRPYYGRPSLVNKTGIDYHITKYYPNDTIARDGGISAGKKVGCWKYWSYEGEMLYEVDYFDSIIVLNDSIKFNAKGILTDYNAAGEKISESFIIEKFEKYDCSHSDHYEIRQLMTIWQGKDSVDRMNGYVKNYYENGVLQNEGVMKDGLPTGVWKFYDPFGKLNQVGNYVLGKRDGRWLGGDLSKTKYLGDICLNPNLPDIEEEIKYREKLLDIVITNYKLGKALNKEFYDVNLNTVDEEGEEEIIESDIELR